MSLRDNVLRWLGSLGAHQEGTEAPAEDSRCYAWVTVALDGRLTQATQPRAVHLFKKRGQPASPVCLRCGAKNTRIRSEVTA